MHSHTSQVANSYAHQIKSFTFPECVRLLETGIYEFDHTNRVHNIAANTTTRGAVVIEGALDGNSCRGGYYQSSGLTWKDVVVTLKYTIRLYEYFASVNSVSDTIELRNGLTCPFSKGSCLDSLEGSVTWDRAVPTECTSSEFVSLFTGVVNKTTSSGQSDREGLAIYSTQQSTGLFSIRTTEKSEACGYIVYKTDHPKVFVYELMNGLSVFRDSYAHARDLDIFTYFNSKINLVESHMQRQLEQLYDQLHLDTCEVERRVLATQLILARLYPNDFAAELMRAEGYTAVVAGEIIYLIQCDPVYVKLALNEACYQEIPVLKDETLMFMTPMTRILQREGNKVECSAFLAPKYRFGNSWYTLDGKVRESPNPGELSSSLKSNWSYTYIPDLMKSGIYSVDQVEQMKTVIYDTSLHRSATNYMKNLLEGKPMEHHSFDIRRMVPDALVESAVQRYWSRFLGFASWIGHFTTAVIGVYMIARAVKFIIDTVIHGKILYDIYGLGWQLLAAFWDSLTSLLSHRALSKKARSENGPDVVIPMMPVAPPEESVTSLYPTLSPPSRSPTGRTHKVSKYDP